MLKLTWQLFSWLNGIKASGHANGELKLRLVWKKTPQSPWAIPSLEDMLEKIFPLAIKSDKIICLSITLIIGKRKMSLLRSQSQRHFHTILGLNLYYLQVPGNPQPENLVWSQVSGNIKHTSFLEGCIWTQSLEIL